MKKDVLKKLNLVLKIIVSAFGLGLFIAHCVAPETWPKTMSYLVTIILPFIPDIFEKIGLKTSVRLQIAYVLFIGLAMVMGIDFDLYKTWYILGNPCFDKIAHTLSGVLGAFVAKEILDRNFKKVNPLFSGLFIISFVALTAAGWECYEFLYDKIMGGHMQTLIADGIDDTMWDIIGALGAGIITAIPLSN
ncbi:MAG: DUF2238 domain-containing protein [Candidatus Saccharibacteria bacterium]|nr:DUF2238 domain-containing protein [Candidatus Saccharibacteria bacterium]